MQDSGHNTEWRGERVEAVKANGKRVFATDFKVWLVAQANTPGVSVAALAMRHEINANQLRRWMRLERLAQAAQAPAVLPVVIAQPASGLGRGAATVQTAAPMRAPIEIEIAGAVVRVHEGAQAATLRVVLQALRA
jgi:transposase